MEVITMNDLEPLDIELLKCVNCNPGLDNAIIENKFNLSAFARIDKLLSKGYILDKRNSMPEGDKSKYLGLYLITEKGLSYLEDYKIYNSNEKKKFYKYSILVPIAVS